MVGLSVVLFLGFPFFVGIFDFVFGVLHRIWRHLLRLLKRSTLILLIETGAIY
jgi:hypothetical protein